MRGPSAAQPTLVSVLWTPAAGAGWLRAVLLAVVGSLLLTVSAKTHVPFWPVPMTMQTFAVMVIAMAFGPRLGAATVALYLIEGAFGLPIFSGTPERGLGLAYMTGPTGGYLAGFLAAAVVLGGLARRGWDRGLLRGVAAFLIGDAVIFICGIGWLSALIGFDKALAAGLVPFLPGEALKVALAAALMVAGWRLFGRKGA